LGKQLCNLEKKSVNLFTRLVLGEGTGQWLKPGPGIILFAQARGKLWPFVHVTLKQLFAINVSFIYSGKNSISQKRLFFSTITVHTKQNNYNMQYNFLKIVTDLAP